MKTAYLTNCWAFESKDMAIVCGNTLHILTIEVPEETKLITGHFAIDEYDKGYCILVPVLDNDSLDWTDLVDYAPLIEFHFDEQHDEDEGTIRTLDCFETKKLNYKVENLSFELQNKIRERIIQIMDSYEIVND